MKQNRILEYNQETASFQEVALEKIETVQQRDGMS